MACPTLEQSGDRAKRDYRSYPSASFRATYDMIDLAAECSFSYGHWYRMPVASVAAHTERIVGKRRSAVWDSDYRLPEYSSICCVKS